jgi:hypothetical protein
MSPHRGSSGLVKGSDPRDASRGNAATVHQTSVILFEQRLTETLARTRPDYESAAAAAASAFAVLVPAVAFARLLLFLLTICSLPQLQQPRKLVASVVPLLTPPRLFLFCCSCFDIVKETISAASTSAAALLRSM